MAVIQVRLRDGRVGSLDDREFDPQSMERLDSPAPARSQQQVQIPQPQQQAAPQEQGLISSILDSILKPARFVGQAGAEAGGAGINLLQKALGQSQTAFNPQIMKPEELEAIKGEGGNRNKGAIALQGAQNIANVASYAVPFGKGAGILRKALLPGAAVGLLGEASNDKATPQSMLEGAALGAGGAGAFGALGSLLSKGRGLASKGLTNTADSLALKSLRPSPSQQAGFFKETGEKMGDFIKQRGLQGSGYDEIAGKVQPLQESFDQFAQNPDLRIKSKDLFGIFEDKIGDLSKSTLPEQKTKAEYLQKVFNNVKGSVNGEEVGADVLTSLRKEADELVKNYKFDDASKGNLQILRDVYQQSVRDAADRAGIEVNGMSAKQLGVELSKYYKLLDVAEKQQFLGQGSLPIGLTGWLGGGLGGAIAGLPGAAVGMASSKFANNPKVIGGASKLAGGLGEILNGGGASQVGQAGGQIAARLPAALSSILAAPAQNNNQQSDTNQSQNFQEVPPAEMLTQSVNTSQPERKITPEMMSRVFMAEAQGQLSAKAANAIKAAYDVQEQSMKDSAKGGSDKGLTSAAAQMLGKANAGNAALTRIDSVLSKNPVKLLLLNTPGTPGARQLEADYSSLADAIGGLRTGASVSPEQSKYYRNILPKVGDSPETIKSKLDAVRQELQFYIKNGPQVSDAYPQAEMGL